MCENGTKEWCLINRCNQESAAGESVAARGQSFREEALCTHLTEPVSKIHVLNVYVQWWRIRGTEGTSGAFPYTCAGLA